MAISTLQAINTKVRRLTRSPSVAQISDTAINEYINTFVLYDFPEHLRLSTLRTTLTFFTQPNIDTYQTNTTDPTNPLYDFKNRYVAIHKPVYISGNPTFLSTSEEEFYGIFPLYNNIAQVGSGNGVLMVFSGTLSAVPVLRNQVTFASSDTANNGLVLKDDGNGLLTGSGNGTINYLTGAYTLNFTAAPGANVAITSQTVPYQAARPTCMLYFDTKFILRPIPDMPYRVQLEVDARPTELLNMNQNPDLNQWWQYIAYGAAKKIFEDRMDLDSVQQIMPEFKQQERLVIRTTLINQAKERTATIFTDQYLSGNQWWPNGTSF